MRTKLLIVMAAIALVIAPVALFAGGQAEPAATPGVTEITMWFGREDFIPDDRFETFHRENPDIRVNFDVIPLEQGLTEFIPAFQAGRAPDVLQLNHFNVIPLVRQGMVQDIGSVIERWRTEDPQDFAQIAPVAFDLATWEGTTYGMSMWAGPRFHVYRKDLFDAAGLPAPETWDDVLDAARALNAPDMLGISLHGSRAHSPWGWFGSKFMNMGGEFVDGVMQIDSPAGIYLLEFHQTLAREGLIDNDVLALNSGDFRAAFIDGRAAQFYEAGNLYPRLNENLEFGEEWVAIVPPYRPGAQNDFSVGGFGWPFYVSARTENLDAIYRIFKYISQYSHEVAIRYQPPTRTTVFDRDDMRAAQPWWEDIKDIYDTMVLFPIHPRMTEMQEVVLDAKQWAFQNPNADPRTVVGRFQAELDAIHAQD